MIAGTSLSSRTLIYDADCGFCTRAARWLSNTGKISMVPWQFIADLSEIGLDERMVTTAAYWFEDGRVTDGAESAIARALIARGWAWAAVGNLILFPPATFVAKPVYRLIARNRHAMPGGTNACRVQN